MSDAHCGKFWSQRIPTCDLCKNTGSPCKEYFGGVWYCDWCAEEIGAEYIEKSLEGQK